MGSQATEIPLLEVGKYASVQVRSFWDTRSFGKRNRIEPIYAMLNSSDSPLKYWATVTSAHGRRITYEGKLNPHARYILSPMRNKGNWKAGSITIRHSGMPGDLLSIGLLHGDSFLNPIPVFDVATLVSNRYHSVRVPIKTAGSLGNVIPMQALLSAFNPTRRSQRALLTVFDPETGEELKPKITSVTGPAKVPLRQGSTGMNSIQLQASVNPSGGTFQYCGHQKCQLDVFWGNNHTIVDQWHGKVF